MFGLALPWAAQWTKILMMPALALVMTLATINVPNDYFLNPRAILKPSLAGILMTYVILSGAILLLSTLLIKDKKWRRHLCATFYHFKDYEFYIPNIPCTKPVAEAAKIQTAVPITAAIKALLATDMLDGLAVEVINIIPATIKPIMAKLPAIMAS